MKCRASKSKRRARRPAKGGRGGGTDKPDAKARLLSLEEIIAELTRTGLTSTKDSDRIRALSRAGTLELERRKALTNPALKPGKKDQRQQAAREASTGKFATPAQPKHTMQ